MNEFLQKHQLHYDPLLSTIYRLNPQKLKNSNNTSTSILNENCFLQVLLWGRLMAMKLSYYYYSIYSWLLMVFIFKSTIQHSRWLPFVFAVFHPLFLALPSLALVIVFNC